MNPRPTEHDGRIALRDHLVEKAIDARSRFGPAIDASTILRMLDDRSVVRYPVGVRFDGAELQTGEFAYAAPLSDHPAKGFCLFIHPALESRQEWLPFVIAYHIPPINYGDIADAEDCEIFGATLLGLEQDQYYDALCSLADALAHDHPASDASKDSSS